MCIRDRYSCPHIINFHCHTKFSDGSLDPEQLLDQVFYNKLKTVFFSLNLTARKPEKSTPETNPYVKKFLKKVKWEPTLKEVFAGRLDYPSLDPLNKLAILFIMFITNGPKDTSKTYAVSYTHLTLPTICSV